jgi:transposase
MSIQLPDARQLSDEALQVLRLRALRGIELGYSELELAELLGVCHETISRWWTAYRGDGLPALPGGRTGRPLGSGRSLSDQQAQRIKARIDFHSPEEVGIAHALWTRRAVRELIRREFGIDLAERTVGLYLRRWGYTSKRPGRHARRQDPDEVEEWLLDTYPAIEAQAEREGAEILWADEAGVAADQHPGYGYARAGEPARLEVPRPHLRVNQIAAISNEGTVRFMTYRGALDAAVFLTFLTRLIAGASRKVLLVVDRLRAHRTPEVEAWVAAHRDRIEVFYLPAYAPELNPVEYLNNDLKGAVNAAGLPRDRPTLRGRLLAFMKRLVRVPDHVVSYFLHPWTQYAAPVELL